MTIRSAALFALATACVLAAGCSHSEGDTSPLPAQSPESRLENARKGIESSNMTPEQKQASIDYMNKGALGAQKMRESAQSAGQPVGK